MFGSGSGENTKDSVCLAVNGVSVLTYEIFCNTALSDNLSMRPALGKSVRNGTGVCVKAGGKAAMSSLERQTANMFFCPLLSSV